MTIFFSLNVEKIDIFIDKRHGVKNIIFNGLYIYLHFGLLLSTCFWSECAEEMSWILIVITYWVSRNKQLWVFDNVLLHLCCIVELDQMTYTILPHNTNIDVKTFLHYFAVKLSYRYTKFQCWSKETCVFLLFIKIKYAWMYWGSAYCI